MKHEHNVNVNLPSEVESMSQTFKRVQDHVVKHREGYLCLAAGLVIGRLSRHSSKSDMRILVIAGEQPREIPYF